MITKEQIIKEGLSIGHLMQYLNEDEGIKAALTNAVHRFYYDYCFSPHTNHPYESVDYRSISPSKIRV